MANEIYAKFIVAKFDVDPDGITAELGIEPTRVLRVGDIFGYGKRVAKDPLWRLESSISRVRDTNLHL